MPHSSEKMDGFLREMVPKAGPDDGVPHKGGWTGDSSEQVESIGETAGLGAVCDGFEEMG